MVKNSLKAKAIERDSPNLKAYLGSTRELKLEELREHQKDCLRKGEHLKAAKIGKFLKQDDTHIQDLAVLAFKELFIKEGCVSPALIEHGREILENYTVNGEKTNAAIFELVKYFNSGVRDGAEFAEQLIRAFHVDSEIIGNAEDITEITLLLRP